MNHTALPSSAAKLGSHVHKTVDFAMHVAIWSISSILAPFAREDTFTRSVRRHWWDRVPEHRELLSLIEIGSSSGASREKLFQKWSINYPDGCLAIEDEADGHAEHGKEMRIVDRPVQRVHTPCRFIVDEVFPRRAFRICLFS